MKYLDREYSICRSSWKSLIGALGLTVAVFLAIASTSVNLEMVSVDRSEEDAIYYTPPPAMQSEEERPLPTSYESDESSVELTIDVEDEALDIALDFLSVSLDHNLNNSMEVGFENQKAFAASAPQKIEFEPLMIYERSQVDQKPMIVYSPQPSVSYKLAKHEVKLIVLYYVNTKGRALNVSILDTTHPDIREFNELAKEAIQRWRFKPAVKNGEQTNCWVTHSFNFRKGSSSPFSIN